MCTLESLTLWDYTPSAIKIAPYYKQLLQWCDSVDVIRSPPYTGPPIRYPDREHDQVSQAVVDGELEHDALDTTHLSSTTTQNPRNQQCRWHIKQNKQYT